MTKNEKADPARAEAAGSAPGASPDAIDENPRSRLARLYAECEVRSDHVSEIDRLYVERILDHRETYRAVGAELGVPWWFVGIIHGLESSFDFGRHLHNGDSLSGRTVRVPKGRPEAGEPPFTWRRLSEDGFPGLFGVIGTWISHIGSSLPDRGESGGGRTAVGAVQAASRLLRCATALRVTRRRPADGVHPWP